MATSRRFKWEVHETRIGSCEIRKNIERRLGYKIVLWMSNCIWENNIKISLEKKKCEFLDWD